MKLEVGMYVRTKWGINKINEYVPQSGQLYLKTDVCHKSNVYKASHNIIDLIEVGDYVNGVRVERIDKDPFIKGQINLWTNEIMSNYWGDISLIPIRDKDIKSILTKEQFSQIEYKVGE